MASNKTVFVGMSGGVDSSLTAALLKEQGYNVVGVYMKNWTEDLPGFACPWKEDFQDAKRVAVRLGIELKVYDFEAEYKQKVVDYMISEYKAGRTPNPDIMCNQEVKFKLFLESALAEGADMIATGHYARILKSEDRDQMSDLRPQTSAALLTAKDSNKDQTYFLYRITEEALKRSIMPIGEFETKEQVRAEAMKRGIETAHKKDSQGICFVGKVGIKDFLEQYVDIKPGPIVTTDGIEVGQHDGAIFYTIGQRHGLNVGGGLPYYVTHKDMETNTVYVTTNLDDASLWSKQVLVRSEHWINQKPEQSKEYKVRLRYRGPLVSCVAEIKDDHTVLVLKDEQRALAAGQSAVLYDGETVLGGGIISEAS